ncbi:MAG: ankyrin repeat domain-containing protein [Brevinema sp.]
MLGRIFKTLFKEKKIDIPIIDYEQYKKQFEKIDPSKNLLEKKHLIAAMKKEDPSMIVGMLPYIDYEINKSRETALHLACKYNYIELVKLLLDKGANFHRQDKYGRTPLHICAMHNSLKIAQLLIDKGAGVGILNNAGETPLHKSAEKDFVEVSDLFISTKKILVNAPSKNGKTPLHLSIGMNCLNTTKLLLDCKAATYLRDEIGLTPFDCVRMNIDMIKLLSQYGLDLTNKAEMNKLFKNAIDFTDKDLVLYLLDLGAGVNTKFESGEYPLYLAIEGASSDDIQSSLDIIQLLIDRGANPKKVSGIPLLRYGTCFEAIKELEDTEIAEKILKIINKY